MMRAVFDMPMGTQQVQQPGRARLLSGQVGDPVDDLLRAFQGVRRASAKLKGLLHSRPLVFKQRVKKPRDAKASLL